jgi:hypothetical protein
MASAGPAPTLRSYGCTRYAPGVVYQGRGGTRRVGAAVPFTPADHDPPLCPFNSGSTASASIVGLTGTHRTACSSAVCCGIAGKAYIASSVTPAAPSAISRADMSSPPACQMFTGERSEQRGKAPAWVTQDRLTRSDQNPIPSDRAPPISWQAEADGADLGSTRAG